MITELVTLMQKLNFNRVTGLTYALLLQHSPLPLEDICTVVKTDIQLVEQTLQQLIRLRLVGKDRQRNRELFYATNPTLGWLSLTADLVWGVKVDLGSMTELKETDDPNVENLRAICSAVSNCAQELYKSHSGASKHKEQDAETLEELARLTCEIIQQARKHIYAVSKSPRLPTVSSFWAVLTNRITQGVKYFRVVDLEEIVDHGLAIKKRDIDEFSVELRVLERSEITHKFYIIDNKFLQITHQETNKGQGIGRVTNQFSVIERYRKRFMNHYLKKSIPGPFVISYMEDAAKELLEKSANILSEIESLWIDDLIKYGRFSKFHVSQGWSKEQFSTIERRVTEQGFVKRNRTGDIIPVYPVDEATLRAAYIESLPPGTQ